MKHGIRPPRKSAGETAAVTIGNQERQIKVLIDRCAALEKQRDDALTSESQIALWIKQLDDARIRSAWSDGYIARVKEEDQRREYPPFPPASGLA